jgi:hypothetical protein
LLFKGFPQAALGCGIVRDGAFAPLRRENGDQICTRTDPKPRPKPQPETTQGLWHEYHPPRKKIK